LEVNDGSSEWIQSSDLSKDNLDKLHELQRLWLIEAVKYNVLPLDYRQIERIIPDKAGRPTLIEGNTQLLFGGTGRLSDNSVLDIKQVVRRYRRPGCTNGWRGGRDHRQGGRFGRVEPLRQGRPGDVLLQRARH